MPRTTSAGHGPGAPPLEPGVAEMRALAHPLRLRILELFAEMPRTTKQVAELLGQPPTRLYHHVAALERAGLLRLKKTRKNRGTIEKWYEAVARSFGAGQVPPHAKGKPSRRLKADSLHVRRAMAMTVLEQSRQEVLSAIGRSSPEIPLLARMVFTGSGKRGIALRKRLVEVLAQLREEFARDEPAAFADDEDLERWSLTLALAPTWASDRR